MCVKDLTLVRILRKFRWRVSVILLMPTLCFLNEIEVFTDCAINLTSLREKSFKNSPLYRTDSAVLVMGFSFLIVSETSAY